MVNLPPEFVRLVQLYRELYSKENIEGLNERDPLPRSTNFLPARKFLIA